MITKIIRHGTETPHFTAEDYRHLKGGKGTMSERMRDWPPFKLGPCADLRLRWLERGCCGRAEGPVWLPAVKAKCGNGMIRFAGMWYCDFAGPGGCCLNRVDEFVKQFGEWLGRGAPLHEGTENGE